MQKSYALFDFDGTLMRGDSIILFCLYARRHGHATGKQLVRAFWASVLYILGMRSAEESKMAALHFIVGKSQAELTALSEAFCRDVLRPRLRAQGVEELKRRQGEGARALLITASPSFYLEPLQAELGLEAIIGTRMDMGMDGAATGLICGENCKGLQKPLRLAEYLAAKGDRLEYDSSYSYGDSLSDLPMMELCGHKVGVNPKRKLRKKLRGAEGATIVRWKG